MVQIRSSTKPEHDERAFLEEPGLRHPAETIEDQRDAKPFLLGKLEQQVCLFLVDTGSSNSLISEDLWLRFFKDTFPLEGSSLKLSGAGGNGLQVKGVMRKPKITLNSTSGENCTLYQDLIVVGGLKAELIAGMNMLRAGEGLVNTADLSLTLYGQTFKMVPSEQDGVFEIVQSDKEKETRDEDWLWEDQRVAVILNQINVGFPGMKNEIRCKVVEAVTKYADVFALEGEVRPAPDIKINLAPIHNIPVVDKSIKIGYHQLETVQEEIRKLAAQGVIRPSDSPYNSRMFLLKKPCEPGEQATFRILQDFRSLNCLLPDLPTQIEEPEVILSSFGDAKYFGVLDLKSSYHQLSLDEESMPLTAFEVNKEKWEFTKLAMGIKTSSSFLVSFVKNMIRTIKDKQMRDKLKTYMDDVALCAKTPEEFVKLLVIIFEKLREFKLYLKASKCVLLKLEVKFLGFLISENRCAVDSSRIDTLMKTKVPTTMKQVRSLLGAAGFLRKHITRFEERCAGLRADLLKCKKKKGPIKLSERGVESFWEVLKGIKDCCDLAFPSKDKRLHLYTDASETVIGGCLLYFDEEESPRVLSFYSKKIPERLIHQHINIKELWGIIQSVERFEYFLKGKRFTLRSDSKVICSPNFMKLISNAAHKRWLDTLYQYDFDLIHISSEENKVADYMTRKDIGEAEAQTEGEITANISRELAQSADDVIWREGDWTDNMVAMVTSVTGAQPERRGQKNESQHDLTRISLIDEQRKDPVIAYMLRSMQDDRKPDPRSPSAELREYLSLCNGLSMDKDGLV